MTNKRKTPDEGRWEDRRILGGALIAATWVIPIVAGIAASTIFARAVKRPHPLAGAIGWWIAVLAVSFVTVNVVDRFSRRLLPLATLYRLSLAFPDRAPSRYRVARRAHRVTDLEHRLEAARAAGKDDDQAMAAERILSLVAALNSHDRRTRGHSERVRVYTDLLAEELKLPAEDRDKLRWAALLHDIGKLEVSTDILNKDGRPDETEWKRIHGHPDAGLTLIGPLRDWLGGWAEAIRDHHERWDGSGYPRGLKRKQISLGGRVVAVADSYETMTAARPYKKPMSMAAARLELIESSGAHFDPAIVRAFLNIGFGNLRRAAGPLAWLLQSPIISRVHEVARPVLQTVAEAGGRAIAVGQAAGAAAGAAAVVATAPLAPIPHAVAPAPVSATKATTSVRTAPPSAPAASDPTHGDAPQPPRGPDANNGNDENARNNENARNDRSPGPRDETGPPATPGQQKKDPTPSPSATPSQSPAPTASPSPSPAPSGTTLSGAYYLASTTPGQDTNANTYEPLRATAPTASTLPNYDLDHNDDPGLTIKDSGRGVVWEWDPEKMQYWRTTFPSARKIAGPVSLTFFSAHKDFKAGKFGDVHAILYTCKPDGSGCDILAGSNVAAAVWSVTGAWVERTIDLGTVNANIPAGHFLGVKIAVDDASGDMWFAYDTTSYPSQLVFG